MYTVEDITAWARKACLEAEHIKFVNARNVHGNFEIYYTITGHPRIPNGMYRSTIPDKTLLRAANSEGSTASINIIRQALTR